MVEKLAAEASDGEIAGEEDLGSERDVPPEVVPLLSSDLERFDQTLSRSSRNDLGQ